MVDVSCPFCHHSHFTDKDIEARKIESFPQGKIANEKQSLDINPGLPEYQFPLYNITSDIAFAFFFFFKKERGKKTKQMLIKNFARKAGTSCSLERAVCS